MVAQWAGESWPAPSARTDPARERVGGQADTGERAGAAETASAGDVGVGSAAAAAVDTAGRPEGSAEWVTPTAAGPVAAVPASCRGQAQWGDSIPAGSRGTALAELSPTPCCPIKLNLSAACVSAFSPSWTPRRSRRASVARKALRRWGHRRTRPGSLRPSPR